MDNNHEVRIIDYGGRCLTFPLIPTTKISDISEFLFAQRDPLLVGLNYQEFLHTFKFHNPMNEFLIPMEYSSLVLHNLDNLGQIPLFEQIPITCFYLQKHGVLREVRLKYILNLMKKKGLPVNEETKQEEEVEEIEEKETSSTLESICLKRGISIDIYQKEIQIRTRLIHPYLTVLPLDLCEIICRYGSNVRIEWENKCYSSIKPLLLDPSLTQLSISLPPTGCNGKKQRSVLEVFYFWDEDFQRHIPNYIGSWYQLSSDAYSPDYFAPVERDLFCEMFLPRVYSPCPFNPVLRIQPLQRISKRVNFSFKAGEM